MTLVRKGLISAAAYHNLYTGALALPYVVGVWGALRYGAPDVLLMMPLAWSMLALRRRGVGKYALWMPVLAAWQVVHRLPPFAGSPARFLAAVAGAAAS
jgi:hypothetical protein